MKYIHYLLMGVLLAAALSVAGCTETPEAVVPVATPEATQTPAETPADWSLTPGPVGTMPVGKVISTSIERDPIQTDLTVRFDGGQGMNFVTLIEATMYTSDGRVETKYIERPLNMGQSVMFDGTRGSDRVKVTAYYSSGEVVVISDALYEFKSR